MTFEKTINPHFETIGRRQKLTGYIGQITDESGVVLHSYEYSNYSHAETALNAVVYDLLMDYAERGLVDTLPACDPPAEPCPLGNDEGNTVPSYVSPSCLVCYDDGFIRGDVGDQPCPYCAGPSLLADIHTVLSRCLSNDALVGIVPEIERVLHRVEQALCVEPV